MQSLLNHDGHFDNFLQVIHDNIGVPDAPPVSNAAAPVAMHAFDGSEIKSDYATLANWYAQRASVPARSRCTTTRSACTTATASSAAR